jgi:hypothetical protein
VRSQLRREALLLESLEGGAKPAQCDANVLPHAHDRPTSCNRIDLAHEQRETALAVFLARQSFAAAITLAGAA